MKLNVVIEEKAYPCTMDTCGAAMLYEEETGKDFSQVDMKKAGDLTAMLWAGCADAHEAEGRGKFPYTLKQFAHALTLTDLAKIMGSAGASSEGRAQGQGGKGEKAKKKARD